jgi:hypothetical protein
MRANFRRSWLAWTLFPVLASGTVLPAEAQSAGVQTVTVRVYIGNKETGTPVVDATVGYAEEGADCRPGSTEKSQFRVYAHTDDSGTAEFHIPTCIGLSTVWVEGPGPFATRSTGNVETSATFVTIVRGQTSYLVRILAQPSNKVSETPRTVHIFVRGKQNGQMIPVSGATIFDVQGNSIATTGADGEGTAQHKDAIGETVVLRAVPPSGGEESWEPASGSFIVGASEGTRITRADDYVTIVLGGSNAPKEEEVTLTIRVRGKTDKGTTAVHYASVYDGAGNHLVTTDYNGSARVRVKAALGEDYVVKVEAAHWKPASQAIVAGSAGTLGSAISKTVNFLLESDAEPTAPPTKELIVEVLDHDTDKPISGATVTVYKPQGFPGSALGHAQSNGQGLAKFDVAQVERAMLNGEARVGATRTGSKPALQTLAQSLLSEETPKYALYLSPAKPPVKSPWNGTYVSGGYTMTASVSGSALRMAYQWDSPQISDKGTITCKIFATNKAECTIAGHSEDQNNSIDYASAANATTASLVNGELWISSGASVKSFTCKTGVGCSRVGADATYVPPSGHWTRH